MLDLRIIANGQFFTLDDAITQLGARLAAHEIGNMIEDMIAKIDALDGDVDLEDDREEDPLDRGEVDETRPDGIPAPLPIYGIDQSAGPLNEAKAAQQHHHAVMMRDWARYPNHLRPRQYQSGTV